MDKAGIMLEELTLEEMQRIKAEQYKAHAEEIRQRAYIEALNLANQVMSGIKWSFPTTSGIVVGTEGIKESRREVAPEPSKPFYSFTEEDFQ